MATKFTGLIIERKRNGGPDWETVAFPKDDIGQATAVLGQMREAEKQKRYPQPLRLVRETREYIDA